MSDVTSIIPHVTLLAILLLTAVVIIVSHKPVVKTESQLRDSGVTLQPIPTDTVIARDPFTIDVDVPPLPLVIVAPVLPEDDASVLTATLLELVAEALASLDCASVDSLSD